MGERGPGLGQDELFEVEPSDVAGVVVEGESVEVAAQDQTTPGPKLTGIVDSSAARREETSEVLYDAETVVGMQDAFDQSEAVAAQETREKRFAAEDAVLARQRVIDGPGAQATRQALVEARAAVHEAPVSVEPVSAADVIPAQSEGPDTRSSMEVAYDRAAVAEREAAHVLAQTQNAQRDSPSEPTIREAAYEGRVEKEHTVAQKARAWLDRRLGRDSRVNLEKTEIDH